MKKFNDLNSAKEYVRKNADLYTLISQDIEDREWEEEGSDGTLVTISPFREENKPSFKVSGDRFKDWGGEQHSGDIFSWVQIWHGLSFVESIHYIANRFNIDIGQFLEEPTQEDIQTSRYKKANRVAAAFMHKLFLENVLVRDQYFNDSGFTKEMIAPYQVGFCPSTESLINHVAKELNLSSEEVFKLEFGRNDLFHNAIVYPVHSHSGEVLYFYTKQLNVDNAPYIGMQSSHPLHDSSVLYGFHVARKNLRKNTQLIIVEGFRDAIALSAAGVRGSKIRREQLESLEDYKIKSIVFCYDGDQTGWTKTLDLVHNPDEYGTKLVLVARPPLDKDPHDVWKEGGDGAVFRMLKDAVVPLEYYINSNFDVTKELSLTDKAKLLTDLQEYLTKVSGLQLSIAARFLSNLLNTTQDGILDFIAELKVKYTNLFNLEAERTLISHCMRASVSYSTTKSAGIDSSAFSITHYQKLFKCCTVAYEKFGDKYTPQVVLDEAMAKYAIQEMPGIVTNALEDNYRYTEVAACDIVLDMWRRRIASDQAGKLIVSSQDLSISFVEIVDQHRKELVSTMSSSRFQPRTPDELADEVFSVVKEREQAGGSLIIGHDFYQLPSVNMVLGGIQPGHMITVAGSTGAGKSLLAMNIIKTLAVDHGIPVLWIGQEMASYENTMRLISMMTGINNTKIQTGSLTQQEAVRFAQAVTKIRSSGFYMAKPKFGTIDEIIAVVDEYKWKFGIKVVVWDYIQLIQMSDSQRGMNREQVIGYASKVVKNKFTEDMGLAALVVAQMNRSTQSEGAERIGGSYQISQDSDDFMFIEKKSKKELEEDPTKGNRTIKIPKRRGGVSDYVAHINLDIDPRSASLLMTECASPSEQSKLYSQLVA